MDNENNEQEIFAKVRQKLASEKRKEPPPPPPPEPRKEAPTSFFGRYWMLILACVAIGMIIGSGIFLGSSDDDGVPDIIERKPFTPPEDGWDYKTDAVQIRFVRPEEEPAPEVEDIEPPSPMEESD
jgi:hypothetical protein